MAASRAQPILSIIDLSKSFRGLLALQNVNLELRPREILGVIGPNGAGKTTLFNCLTGYTSPTTGKILFENRDIVGWQTPQIVRLGFARTFQNIRLFGALSVLDNVRVAQQLRTDFTLFDVIAGLASFNRKERQINSDARALLTIFDLLSYEDALANSLPYGAQRRLEIARALATRPKILLLDEPAAGMNDTETNALHSMILQVREQFGVSIILVEHDMRLIMNLCERIVVLNHGQVIADGIPSEIQKNSAVIESYLGKVG
jgi:branched-chain amino acid transport system ATP-binding protein